MEQFNSIWMAGYNAAKAGVKWWDCPYEAGSVDAYTWDQGHTRWRVYGGL